MTSILILNYQIKLKCSMVFQTLFVDKDLMLCDCPGLVMPSFVFTKADLIINGILPIDQMRDHRPPVNLICSQIPRHILEDQYSIMVTKPLEGEDPNRAPTADELLNAYACNLINNLLIEVNNIIICFLCYCLLINFRQ